jgi:hypothetical protein
MRLALLSGAAALSLIGVASAQAETVYVTDPGYATAPGYVYAVPAPPAGPFTPRYVVTEPAPAYVAEPPVAYVQPPAVAVAPPVAVAPGMAYPPRSGMVTTGYSTRCFVDLAGIERCY